MKQFSIILILFLTQQSFGQNLIKGIVSNTVNEPLPGATVFEVGTKNGVVTDIDGQYKVEVSDTSSVLQFSFVGLITKNFTIGTKNELNVYLEPDTVARIITCYYPLKYTELGYSAGVNFTPIGFKMKNQTPYLFGINLELESSITYRKKDNNEYLDIYLWKKDLFTIGNFGIGLMGEFRKFSIANDKFKEFKLAPSFALFGILLTVGYSNQFRKLANTEVTGADGVFLGITKFFPFAISVSVKSQYLQDLWQFNVDFSKHFYRPNLTVAIGYERLYTFDEFDLTLSYRIEY